MDPVSFKNFSEGQGSSGTRRPAIKGSNAQEFMRYLDVFQAGTGAKVRARLPSEIVHAVFGGTRVSWISVEDDGLFVDAVIDELGSLCARRARRQFTGQVLAVSPLMRAVFDGAIRRCDSTVRFDGAIRRCDSTVWSECWQPRADNPHRISPVLSRHR